MVGSAWMHATWHRDQLEEMGGCHAACYVFQRDESTLTFLLPGNHNGQVALASTGSQRWLEQNHSCLVRLVHKIETFLAVTGHSPGHRSP